jgi:apolipoprotein N-acyltransferase
VRAPSSVLPLALALVAGLGQAFSIASPWNGHPQWWLQLLSLAMLAGVLLRASSWRQAALAGWLFALAWLAGTWWWLFISMHVYGGLAAPLAVLAVLALAAFLGLYYALAAALFALARERGGVLRAFAFAGTWLLAELMRATLFTGFPWGAGGYAHVDGPLAALAPSIGVYGIGFVSALIAYELATLARLRPRASTRAWLGFAITAGAVLACNAIAPRDEAPAGRKLSIALLQGNIPQDEKFEPGSGVPLALEWYAQQLQETQASLTVTPETAIPVLPQQLPPNYQEAVVARFRDGEHAALIGIPLGSFDEGYSNSVLGFAAGQKGYRYDKHHLVPFGEFIPPLFKWFVRMMNIPLGDFNRGALPQPPFLWAGERLAPNICYEDLFGEEIAANFADASRAPTIFVNMSNIGWFGDTVAIDQHLAISRMRAIEFHRPVIRATNTGATAIIDADGRVTRLLPRLTRGVLTGEVQGRTGITPYAAWLARLGLAPLWLVALAAAALALVPASRKARP